MPENNALVLEVLKQEEQLAMTIFAQQEITSTLRHYSRLKVIFSEIDRLCADITAILNRADSKGNLSSPNFADLKKTGSLLWDQLLTRQVKEKLKQAATLDLILAIDEELVAIPWELLYTGDEFLCLKFNLGRLVRTQKQPEPLSYRGFSTGTLRMLILANPTGDLNSSYQEGLFIKNHFDKKRKEVSINFKSSAIDTLYVKKNLRDYDIVHFAGHCEYDSEQPQSSGWLFSDGKFAISDIQALNQTLALPSLVFSNACHSAGSKLDLMRQDYQKENYNLASAFLFSGVRHYIGAIRKIEDRVSLDFAREFYTCLTEGKSVGTCLRVARLKLIRQYGQNTIWWAAHLLYGDPNFTLFKKSPAQRAAPKVKLTFSKKRLQLVVLALTTLVGAFFLFRFIVSLKPNSQLMFLRAQDLFLRGKNAQVILLSERIISKDPSFASVYPQLAEVYQRLGKKEQALKYYFDYARLSEKKEDKKNLASAYTGIGWIYYLHGEYAKAWEFYQKALNLSIETQDKLAQARVLERMAVWYMDKEDYDKSLELLMKSSQINKERQYSWQHRYGLACDYFDIGLVFMNKDDFATAREFYQKSRALFEKLKLKHELSDYYFNLGEISMYEKQYQQALDYYLKGLAIDQQQGHKVNLVSDYNMLGELYLEMDNPNEAEKFFLQAVALAREIDAPLELASAYYNLGLVYKKRGLKSRTREYFRQAQEIYYSVDNPWYQRIKKELSLLYTPSQ